MARSFSYSVTTHCPPERAAAVLADIGHQRAVHPLIIDIQEQPPRPGALRSYRITDRVPFGPVRLRVTYAADLLSAAPNEVVSLARQRPATTVRNRTLIARRPNLTEITVEITITAPRLLQPYVVRQARRAHAAVARRLGPYLDQQ